MNTPIQLLKKECPLCHRGGVIITKLNKRFFCRNCRSYVNYIIVNKLLNNSKQKIEIHSLEELNKM